LELTTGQQDDLPIETNGGMLQDHDHKLVKVDRWTVHLWELAVDDINEAVDNCLFPLKRTFVLQFVHAIQQQGLIASD